MYGTEEESASVAGQPSLRAQKILPTWLLGMRTLHGLMAQGSLPSNQPVPGELLFPQRQGM